MSLLSPKNAARTLFHLQVPWTEVFWDHMTFFTKRKTETYQTLPKNPQNSIENFYPLEGGGGKSLKLKIILKYKKIQASNAITNMYVPQRTSFLK